MPEITIKYFDIKGRAEPIRLALTVGGIAFNDDRFQFDEFNEIKESGVLPFGQVPVMIVDGQVITQSGGILRYCGKLAGLYPRDDDLLAARIDEVLGVLDDVNNFLFTKYQGKDEEKKKEVRGEFVKSIVPRFMGGLDRLASKASDGSFICGDKMTIADLTLYYSIWNIKSGIVDYVPTDIFDKYTRLMSSYNAVLEHPKVVEWNRAHPAKKA